MAKRNLQSQFKSSHTLEERIQIMKGFRKKHPDRLPLICEKVVESDIRDLDNCKFLVPSDLTIGQFVMVLRKRVQVEAEEAIFVFVNGTIPPTTAQMSDLYARYKDEDRFLYIKYSREPTFGC